MILGGLPPVAQRKTVPFDVSIGESPMDVDIGGQHIDKAVHLGGQRALNIITDQWIRFNHIDERLRVKTDSRSL